MAKLPGINFVQARHIGSRFSAGNPVGLVLHRTVGGYAGIFESFRSGNKVKSAHFLIGKNEGEVAQMADTDTIAYHVGNANSFYLGIEFESCDNRPGYEGKFDPLNNADPL